MLRILLLMIFMMKIGNIFMFTNIFAFKSFSAKYKSCSAHKKGKLLIKQGENFDLHTKEASE